MKITNLIEFFEQYISNINTLIGEIELEIIKGEDKKLWLFDANNFEQANSWHDTFSDKHGIYFLVDNENDVLYIGQAYKQSITKRIWGHLKTPDKKSQIRFPNNRFKPNKNDNKAKEAKIKIDNGRFKVAGAIIKPEKYCSLLETSAITYVWHNDGERPPFNKKFS